MKKILVIGSGGAGKSTLARRLYEMTGIEIYHLDKIFWQPGWASIAREELAEKIKAILNHFRNNVIEEFAGIKVVGKEDYLLRQKTKNNVVSPLDFPASDVIKYYLEDGTWLAIRPSGTEPKCKFYFCVLGNSEEEVKVKFNSINQALKTHLE